MSLLFNKRSRNVIKKVWGVFAVVIMLSMVLLYTPGILALFS